MTARLTVKCPKCGKIAIARKEYTVGKRIGTSLECGHFLWRDKGEILEKTDEKWEAAFPFQQDGVKFIEGANYIALIADEMGLGKTIQALLALRRNPARLLPVLILCKASLSINWMREYSKWAKDEILSHLNHTNELAAECCPVFDGTCEPLPGFQVYVCSIDLLSKPKIREWILKVGFSTFIVDECHNFKNEISKRLAALREVIKNVPHRIFLSGTPITNNALEYFPILNLLDPVRFPYRQRFANQYLDYDYRTKKWLGLHKNARQYFFQVTQKYIIRREKKEVLKDLPEKTLNDIFISDFSATFIKQYNEKVAELEKKLALLYDETAKKAAFMDILALLSRLRHFTGLMKVTACAEHAVMWLENMEESEKLCIGVWHKDVAFWLSELLKKYDPIMISGDDDAIKKQEKEDLFRSDTRRLAVVNIKAVNEGRNFQFCHNVIVLERQWNPASESQFGDRFHRFGQEYPVQIDYLIAAETIDEFFDSLIKLKYQLTQNLLDASVESNYDLIYDLARQVVSKRLAVTGR